MGYPKTLAALRDQEDRSWPVADALLEEIQTYDTGIVKQHEYSRCSAWLAEQGYEAKPHYLAAMRVTAKTFSSEERVWRLPFRIYMEASGYRGKWTPELMERAEREHMTLREFSRELTGKSWSDDHKPPADPNRMDVLSALVRAKQSIREAAHMTVQANLAGSKDAQIAQLADEVTEALAQLIRVNSGVTLDQELENILKGE